VDDKKELNDVQQKYFHFICYHIKQKHCIFFSAKTFVYDTQKCRKAFEAVAPPQTRLGELTTLPDLLVAWAGGYPLPNRHSVDAFGSSFQ